MKHGGFCTLRDRVTASNPLPSESIPTKNGTFTKLNIIPQFVKDHSPQKNDPRFVGVMGLFLLLSQLHEMLCDLSCLLHCQSSRILVLLLVVIAILLSWSFQIERDI